MRVLILHNVRSAHNVGSIFRTADACGINHIYLVGYTPSPHDSFGRINTHIAKTSLGAEKTVPWSHHSALRFVIRKLKNKGVRIVAVEQDSRSVNYKTWRSPKECAFVFGNEPRGLSRQALALCDEILEIPMRGKKESLNVSVAAGIILFHGV